MPLTNFMHVSLYSALHVRAYVPNSCCESLLIAVVINADHGFWVALVIALSVC